MNPIEALGIAFWVILFAIVIAITAEGGWSGLTGWLAVKFGPVGGSQAPVQPALGSPGTGTYQTGPNTYTNLPPGLPT